MFLLCVAIVTSQERHYTGTDACTILPQLTQQSLMHLSSFQFKLSSAKLVRVSQKRFQEDPEHMQEGGYGYAAKITGKGKDQFLLPSQVPLCFLKS